MHPIFIEYNRRVHANRFPHHRLNTNFNIDDFAHAMTDFRGLELNSFNFTDDAGADLANLMVSIHRGGLFKSLIRSKLWRAKRSCLISLKQSMRHFVAYLEHEQRVTRAVCGLTALGSLQKAILSFPRVCVVFNLVLLYCQAFCCGIHVGEVQHLKVVRRGGPKTFSTLTTGSVLDVWHQMVQKAMRGLKYISDHKDEPRIWCKKVHNLANLFLLVIVFLTAYPGRCGGWELLFEERCG